MLNLYVQYIQNFVDMVWFVVNTVYIQDVLYVNATALILGL